MRAPARRCGRLIAPAGFGKTTAVHAAAVAAARSGRPVLGVATTNRAVAELRDVGIPAVTIARLAIDLADRPLAPGTVVILDETSQTSTADARVVLDAVADAHAAHAVVRRRRPPDPGRRAPAGWPPKSTASRAEGRIPAAALADNRRQQHPAERQALAAWRAGDLAGSQAMRAGAGLEHEHATPSETREAMADAVTADIVAHGPLGVVALAVSHADCEDLADRIRDRLTAAGRIAGPALAGPGWGTDQRTYQAGDRVLLHANLRVGKTKVANGTTLTVTGVTEAGLAVTDQHDARLVLAAAFVAGARGPTGGRTCRTGGAEPWTVARAAPGSGRTCSAPPRSTTSARMSASPGPGSRPTPGTWLPFPPAIGADGSSTSAAAPDGSSTPPPASRSRPSPPTTTR